mmetsp:Transcript_19371/g.46646  ORF Transcript_19371/g.46646 Transcript_19371/m.46646 type:complete len:214 (-) Transcript_19371:597-1238(-)
MMVMCLCSSHGDDICGQPSDMERQILHGRFGTVHFLCPDKLGRSRLFLENFQGLDDVPVFKKSAAKLLSCSLKLLCLVMVFGANRLHECGNRNARPFSTVRIPYSCLHDAADHPGVGTSHRADHLFVPVPYIWVFQCIQTMLSHLRTKCRTKQWQNCSVVKMLALPLLTDQTLPSAAPNPICQQSRDNGRGDGQYQCIRNQKRARIQARSTFL